MAVRGLGPRARRLTPPYPILRRPTTAAIMGAVAGQRRGEDSDRPEVDTEPALAVFMTFGNLF